MQDRIRAFEGIHNFRDYGGYRTHDGGTLRTGLLWRSGQHVDATPVDLQAIASLKLATIIDLRGNQERADFPCARPAGFAAKVLFADGETAGSGQAPHIQAGESVITASQAHERMVDLYRLMPFRPLLGEIYQAYFRTLAYDDGASLLHCLAGKDRTGLAAAIAHHLLGVHDDDVMADYMLTNSAGNIEARIAAGAKTVRANFGPAMHEDAVRTLMSVDPAYLNTALVAIKAEHGTIRAYARELLGVDDAMLSAMQARLVG